MNVFRYTLVALALAAVQLAGCVGTGTGVGYLAFSPDGSHVCYIHEDRIEEKVVDGKIWLRSINLRWCNTVSPEEECSIHINTLGSKYRGYLHVGTEVKWSPDGSHIGVWTPHKLSIVDIDSGHKREIHDGTITSFAWLESGQLTYLTRRIGGNRQRLVVCRVAPDTQQRTDAFTFPERPKNISIGSGHWSPSGKFLILMQPSIGGQYCCINVIDGAVCSFGRKDAHNVGVSWTPDSSRAFCVSRKVGPGDVYEALLFNPANGGSEVYSFSILTHQSEVIPSACGRLGWHMAYRK